MKTLFLNGFLCLPLTRPDKFRLRFYSFTDQIHFKYYIYSPVLQISFNVLMGGRLAEGAVEWWGWGRNITVPYTNGNMFQKQNKIYMRGANADNDLRMGEFVMCGSVRRLKGLLVILFGFPILYECCYIDVWQFILSWIEIVHCCHCGHPPRRRAGQGSFYTTRNLMLSSI